MRYTTEMIACADKLDLYTIWAMLTYAQELNRQPISRGDWFLSHQVNSFVECINIVSKYLRVRSTSIDQFTVDFVLNGLANKAMLCLVDSDCTCYNLEYSLAAEFLQDKLAERFKC